ncbi:MAG: DUF3500 domain-containing protein [Pseudomonadota bacterium]
MREKALAWLDLLDDRQRDHSTYAFDSRTRKAWNYMLGSNFANGLALETMQAPQKDAALDLLSASLSAYGFETAQNIMLQQDILRDEWGKGSPDRNRERFSLMIFGTPTAEGAWSWRWEGHHLTITFTLVNDEIVAQTPKAFSSEPNTVPSGPHRGLVVLPENEALGRALFADLTPSARQAAWLSERSFGNIITRPGQEARITAPEGVAVGDLTQTQVDVVARLVALYTSDHLPGAVRDTQQARIATEDPAAIRFGWAGPNETDRSMYYRIHGESFLIEFATLRRQPQHQHTIVHDLQHNFGAHLLG